MTGHTHADSGREGIGPEGGAQRKEQGLTGHDGTAHSTGGPPDQQVLEMPIAGCSVIRIGERGYPFIYCGKEADRVASAVPLSLPYHAGFADLPSASLTTSLLLPHAPYPPGQVKAFPKTWNSSKPLHWQDPQLGNPWPGSAGRDQILSCSRQPAEANQALLQNASKRKVSARSRRLQRSLKRFARSQDKNMRVGVHVLHVRSGEEAGVRGRQQFPLASVVKLPIMLEGVAQLQESERTGGKLSLHTPVQMAESDKCIGSGKLWKCPAGTRVAYGACLELMQTISDNTAADLVLRVATLEKVRQRMCQLGMEAIDVHLSQRQAYLIALGQAPQLYGMTSRQMTQMWTGWSVERKMKVAQETAERHRGLRIRDLRGLENVSEKLQQMAGSRGYREDMAVAMAVDNVGPPAAVARMLGRLASGELLAPRWTAHCMGILSRQQFGQRRLPAYLPRGTAVHHKTGSILGVVNAAGIIDVGSPTNRIAVAAFVDNVRRNHEREAEAVIARISRMAYNAYSNSRLRSKLLKRGACA